jgi:Xaa-Pro aminopeptidase
MQNLPVIRKEEFKNRMDLFKAKMEEKSIDMVVIFSNLLDPSSVRYFSDVSPINESSAIVIPLKGEPILCSGQACHEWSKYKSQIDNIRIMPEVGEVSGVEYEIEGQLDFKDLFLEMKNKYTIKKIGIVGDLIFPFVIYKKLLEIFPKAKIISAENLVYELRMKKSPDEISCMRKAGQIVTDAYSKTVPKMKSGMTELDIQADIEANTLKLGAEDHELSFSPMVPSGKENTNLCMNRNTLRKIKEGEMINICSGALYEGYNAMACTPVILGKIPKEISDAVKVAQEAKEIVADSLKPGTTSKQLYDIYKNYLIKKGYAEYSPYGSVHSIGMLECETPFFGANSDVQVLENMTIAIDAYFKDLSFGSFRIEDTYLINSNGSESLTNFNKGFIETLI